jgi:hypothetical protein
MAALRRGWKATVVLSEAWEWAKASTCRDVRVTDEATITVVVCGHCGVRFSTRVPRYFLQRVRRCGACGECALVIEQGSSAATGETEGTNEAGREARGCDARES